MSDFNLNLPPSFTPEPPVGVATCSPDAAQSLDVAAWRADAAGCIPKYPKNARTDLNEKIRQFEIEWRGYSILQAIMFIWVSYNLATKDLPKVYPKVFPKNAARGMWHRDPICVAIHAWVGRNWENWGELWMTILRMHETNAIMRGDHGTFSKPSIGWLFLVPPDGDVPNIEQALRGNFRIRDFDPSTDQYLKTPDGKYQKPYGGNIDPDYRD